MSKNKKLKRSLGKEPIPQVSQTQKTVSFSGYLPPQAWNKITVEQIDKMINGHFEHLNNTDKNISKQLDNDSKRLDNEKDLLINDRMYIISNSILFLACFSIFFYFIKSIPEKYILYFPLLLLILVVRNSIVNFLNMLINKLFKKSND